MSNTHTGIGVRCITRPRAHTLTKAEQKRLASEHEAERRIREKVQAQQAREAAEDEAVKAAISLELQLAREAAGNRTGPMDCDRKRRGKR